MAPFSERFAVAIDKAIECGSFQGKKKVCVCVCVCEWTKKTHSSECQMQATG